MHMERQQTHDLYLLFASETCSVFHELTDPANTGLGPSARKLAFGVIWLVPWH